MIHDQTLVDRLSRLKSNRFEGEVFRATGISVDPTAPSITGGRWGMPPNDDPGTSVLYTSLVREGALAELCSFLADLTPIPKARPIKVSRLKLTASRVVSLSMNEVGKLGVEKSRFGERDYRRTQEIGAALSFLEYDGLIAPSARWKCNNLTLFCANHEITETLDVISSEQVDWRDWAQKNEIVRE
jgi:hypothetical protein